MATLKEKIGYGLGDMSSSMFWKIFSYYLPIFYSDVFGLSLGATAVLMLVTRIWDTVSDPVMGIIADRTDTRWGKYRPWLLWMAVVDGCSVCSCRMPVVYNPAVWRGRAFGLGLLHIYANDDSLYRNQCALWLYARCGYG